MYFKISWHAEWTTYGSLSRIDQVHKQILFYSEALLKLLPCKCGLILYSFDFFLLVQCDKLWKKGGCKSSMRKFHLVFLFLSNSHKMEGNGEIEWLFLACHNVWESRPGSQFIYYLISLPVKKLDNPNSSPNCTWCFVLWPAASSFVDQHKIPFFVYMCTMHWVVTNIYHPMQPLWGYVQKEMDNKTKSKITCEKRWADIWK